MTNNLSRLRQAVNRVQFVPPSGYIGGGVIAGPRPSRHEPGIAGSTALWDAIWVTSDEVLGPAPEKTRRAIILMTDGVNTSGKKKLDDAVQAALKAEAIIYTIGIGDNFYSGVDQGAAQQDLRTHRRPGLFSQGRTRPARRLCPDTREMRSHTSSPTNQRTSARDGSYRTIEIQLTNPQLQKDKIKVTHRQGYFAKSTPKK
jgi:hypothetical protein